MTKTRLGEFVASVWTGENLSGFEPIGDQVLVLPDKAPEKTAGGIVLPQAQRESQSLSSETGVIVAIGDGAWTWNMDRTRRFVGKKPEVGQRVCFTRYAGLEVIGNDGELYRVMSDACIGCLRVGAAGKAAPAGA